MNIAIIAPGSRGDVEPYLALGKGLQAAGHATRLVTHQTFEGLVNAHGVEFWPMAGDVQAVAQSQQMRQRLDRGSFLSVMSQMAKEAESRALYLAEGALAACHGTDLVLAIDSAPFAWLFPQVAAVVHHGGAGTTAAGLRGGIPSVVVPFFGDQPFWGRRVAELGVGPAPILQRKLTADRLAQAIHQAVTDQGMRQRAADLGSRIRAEDGIACVASIVDRLESGD
jgi:UDP:flavonoid glycosyltransferase YjiC (YdhE family)